MENSDERIKVYEGMLELSDKRVLWEIRNPKLDDDTYFVMVASELKRFKDTYGETISLLGRSGRHVCVPDTQENRERYREMVGWVEASQNRLVAEANKYDPEDDEPEFPEALAEKEHIAEAIDWVQEQFECNRSTAWSIVEHVGALVFKQLAKETPEFKLE